MGYVFACVLHAMLASVDCGPCLHVCVNPYLLWVLFSHACCMLCWPSLTAGLVCVLALTYTYCGSCFSHAHCVQCWPPLTAGLVCVAPIYCGSFLFDHLLVSFCVYSFAIFYLLFSMSTLLCLFFFFLFCSSLFFQAG